MSVLFLSKYTCFERKVDIIQMILWYKNMNIYNHQPQLHTITPPPYKKERKIKAFNKMKRYIFFYTVKITATTVVQLCIHSKVTATQVGSL